MSTTHEFPEWLTDVAAGRLASVSGRTLRRWSAEGRAPRPIKIGEGIRGALRYRRSDLLRWIGDGCPRCDVNGEGGA